ncbi:MAG TPA: hypothetical protein VE266_12420 [Steroidobacteraceae bacterium]|jgi:hypothetical protein|nr:hypothetical protein [Steroidobacteraceae bacterium]
MSGRNFGKVSRNLTAIAILGAALLAAAPQAGAVPSFARQTNLACEACHTVYPELTHFGRVFKANGYILSNVGQVRDVTGKKEELLSLAQTVPLSIMAQISYSQMKTSVPDLSTAGAPGVAQNGTAGFPQQLSLFYAGKVAPNFGAFFQITYANDSGTVGIDNTDLRFANTTLLSNNSPLTYGISLNNNPTVQDLWNTTPAWGYPYTASNAVVSPLAGTAIDGAFAQDVAGITGYLFWNESLYAEFGGYRSAKQGQINQLTGGAGPLDGTASNVMSGVAPYWRVAYEYNRGQHSIEAGLYGAEFRLYPGAGPLTGPLNRFKDVAEDVQYQFISDEHQVTIAGTHIHESQTLDASFASGGAANPTNNLSTTRVWATYYYRRKIGGTVAYFSTTGSTDTSLYPPTVSAPGGNPGVIVSANGSPDTRGWIAEVNYLPWLNVKISAQYTYYNKFNGAGSNYDGLGRSASDNNALYLLLWFAF